jgi:hypothetical protein
MPGTEDAQQVMEALAMTGATTLVAAMATGAWQGARAGAARLFHRGGHALPEIEGRLDSDAEIVKQAKDPDGARADLAGGWKQRLALLLREFPDARADLAALIDQVRGELPSAQAGWVQTNLATDHGVVNAVQHGNLNTFHMDSPNPQELTARKVGEAEA